MEKNLTEGSVVKNLLFFSLPYLLSSFLQTLYGLADLFIAGQFNGAAVISAVSVGSQVMHMLTVILLGLAMGTTVLISRAVGSGDRERSAKVIASTIVVFSILAIFLTVLLIFLCSKITEILFVPEEAVKDCHLYLKICFSGIPFIVAYNIIASVYRGMGDTRTPLYFVAFACVLNIALDYIFMGPLKMGAAGAAFATVIAQAFSVFLSIAFFVKDSAHGGIKLNRRHFKFDWEIFSSLFKIGLPVAFQDGFIQISFMVITVIANARGVDVAAAVGIVEKIISFLFLVPSAMLSSISAIAAQNIGGGKSQRAKETLFTGMALSLAAGAFFVLVFQFANEWLVGKFTYEKNVILLGGQYLKSYVFDCFFAAISFSFSGYFCAWGMSYISFLSNVISVLLVRIPGAYYASQKWPDNLYPMGWAAPLGSLLSALLYLLIFLLLRKRKFAGKTLALKGASKNCNF